MSVTDDELVSLECASCLKTGDMRVWTRDVVRSRRPRDVRAKTINTERMSKLKLAIGRELYPTPDDVPARPKTRAGCVDVPRPCPYVSCKHNLYLDVSPKTGSIKLNFPDIDPDQMTTPSCSLDVADKRGETLEEVGRNMNMTRERVRQIEVKSLTKMRPHVTGDLRDAFCTPVGFHDGGECE